MKKKLPFLLLLSYTLCTHAMDKGPSFIENDPDTITAPQPKRPITILGPLAQKDPISMGLLEPWKKKSPPQSKKDPQSIAQLASSLMKGCPASEQLTILGTERLELERKIAQRNYNNPELIAWLGIKLYIAPHLKKAFDFIEKYIREEQYELSQDKANGLIRLKNAYTLLIILIKERHARQFFFSTIQFLIDELTKIESLQDIYTLNPEQLSDPRMINWYFCELKQAICTHSYKLQYKVDDDAPLWLRKFSHCCYDESQYWLEMVDKNYEQWKEMLVIA